MPKVQQYGGLTQTTEQVRGARASAATVDIRPVSQGLSVVADTFNQLQKQIDTTEAEASLVQFEREKNKLFFDPDAGYFNNQGRDAYDKAGDTTKSLAALKEQYLKNMKSDTAKQMFTRAADSIITSGNRDIMSHATKGIKAWEAATIEARVENSIENASLYWNDGEKLSVQREIGRQSVIDAARIQGITGEALNEKLQTYESSFTSAAIEAAANKSTSEAESLMKKFNNRLEGPDKIRLEKMIDTKAKAEKTRYDAQYATLQATTIVNQNETRAQIIDEVNKISDPERRDKTMREAMYQFGLRKQAESEEQADVFQEAQKSQLSAVEFQAQNPDQWNKLSAEQQSKLMKGIPVVTDQVIYSDLMLLPEKQLAKVEPAKYITKLSDADYKKLVSAVKTARGRGSDSDKADSQAGRTRTSQTSLTVQQLFGKKTEWKSDDIVKVNAFYDLVDTEVQFRESELQRKLTSEEYTNLLGGLSRKVVKEGLVFDSEIDLNDIPAEYMPQLTQLLRDNNIPVTADNLLKAYEQASK